MASIPAQEEVLAATRKSQEAMVAAVKTWLETVRTVTPKVASVYSPLTDRLLASNGGRLAVGSPGGPSCRRSACRSQTSCPRPRTP